MTFALSVNEAQELRRLIPLNTLSTLRFEQLCSEIRIEDAEKGATLFHQGDSKNEFVYVLNGTISLQAGGVEMDSVRGGTDAARFALAHQLPRKVSAVAKDRVRYVRIQPELINQRDEPRQEAAYKVSEPDDDDDGRDWISSLLRSPVFQRLPPSNLQAVLRNVEEIPVKAGDVICRQDDPGDYYYIIKKGRCTLTRKPSRLAREIKLATLKACDTFGEDALISEQPRTVTVTMATDGVLLRLDKHNFLKLVRDPVINHVAADAVLNPEEDMVLLDVRLPDQFQTGHIPGSSNVPFFSLRMMLPTLSRQKRYIVICDTGKISEAAAFQLLRHGLQASVLGGGFSALPAGCLVRTPEPPSAAENASAISKAGSSPPPALSLTPEPGFVEPGSPEDQDLQEEISEDSWVEPASAPRETATPAPEGVAGSLREEPHAEISPTPLPEADEETLPPTEPDAAYEVDVIDSDVDAAGDIAADRWHPYRSEQAPNLQEIELKRLLAERTQMGAQLDAARKEAARWQAELKTLWEEHARLQASHDEKAIPDDAAAADRLRELEELQIVHAEVLSARECAAAEIDSLKRQVAELQTVVEEFLEHGASTPEDDLAALQTELSMLRAQAGEDLNALQARLSESEKEVLSLRGQLETAQRQIAVRDAAAAAAQDDMPQPDRYAVLRRIAWTFAAALVLAVLMVLGLIGLDAGRELLRYWLDGAG